MRNRESVYFAQLFYGSQKYFTIKPLNTSKTKKTPIENLKISWFVVSFFFLLIRNHRPPITKENFTSRTNILRLNRSTSKTTIWKPLPFVHSLRCFWFIVSFFFSLIRNQRSPSTKEETNPSKLTKCYTSQAHWDSILHTNRI